MTNLASNLTETTRAHGDRIAVRVDDAVMTYRELDEASARVAGLLHERGLKPGDRVGIMMPNVAEVPVVYYGVLRAGGIVVPMNPLLKAREVAYYLGDSGAGLIFAWHAFAGEARGGAEQANAEPVVVDTVSFPGLLASAAPDYEVADTDDEDTAVILYTSGTTGHPGARLVQRPVAHRRVVHPYGHPSAVGPGGVGQVLGQVRHVAHCPARSPGDPRSRVPRKQPILVRPAH